MTFIHSIDPVLLHLGPLEIHWYGLIYACAFVFAYMYARNEARKGRLAVGSEAIDWLFIMIIIFDILGARLFEILFYQPGYYFSNPLKVFALWEGGLSFHGGLAGIAVALWMWCRKYKVRFLQLADILVVPAALGLALGRIANFINGELYGTPTMLPWGVKFSGADGFRHPTQLYESAKNFLLFFILWPLRHRMLPEGTLFGIFLVGYSFLRFLIEFLKVPETMIGPLTMGQALNVPLFLIGIWLLWKVNRKKDQ